MASIPRDIFEAAALDGVNRATLLFRIVVPLLWDNVQVAFVYLGIIALDFFAIVNIMTPHPESIGDSTEVVAHYLFTRAFSGDANPHQEGLRTTYAGDEAVEVPVLRGRVAILPATGADGGSDGPPRWAAGELVLEDGTVLQFSVQDDSSGGQASLIGARAAQAQSHHTGLSGIDVPASS
jgi:hypothetical protein